MGTSPDSALLYITLQEVTTLHGFAYDQNRVIKYTLWVPEHEHKKTAYHDLIITSWKHYTTLWHPKWVTFP